MSFALVYVALPMVTMLGLAFAWYFRPYGWLGQKIRFFGPTHQVPTVIAEYDRIMLDALKRNREQREADRIFWRDYCRAHPWPYGPDPSQ